MAAMPAWRRNQIAVTIAACLVFAGFTLVLPFLPYYVEQVGVHGRAVDIWSGVLLSVAPFLAALMAPLWGRLADRYGMKIMVQRTMLAMLLHWTLFAFARSVTHLLVLRIFLGLFSGFATMSVALVTHGAPREKIGSIVGTLQSAQILAAAAGPFLGGALYEAIGLRATCLVTAVFCLAGFVLVTFAYDERHLDLEDRIPTVGLSEADGASLAAEEAGAGRPDLAEMPRPVGPGGRKHRAGRLTIRQIWELPGFSRIATVLFFATVISRSFALMTPLFVRHLAAGSGRIGLIAGVAVSAGSFAEALSATVQGRAAERYIPEVLLFLGLAVASVAVLPMVLVASVIPFIALRVLQGLVSGGSLTLGYTMGGAIFPSPSRAMAYGLLSSSAMLGGAIGPVIAGLVSYRYGIRWVFACASIGYTALALVALNSIRRDLALRKDRPAHPPHPYIPVPR